MVLKENTEAMVLSASFKELGIELELHSNDDYWRERDKAGAVVSRDLIRTRLMDPATDVVHFAIHGGTEGFVLDWSGPIENRVPADILRPEEIRAMDATNKLIVSGGCRTGHLADEFLAAGARGFVAPEIEVPWAHLGAFFRSFYGSLKEGAEAGSAVANALDSFPEFKKFGYRLHERPQDARGQGQ
jgi:hypothetical protein